MDKDEGLIFKQLVKINAGIKSIGKLGRNTAPGQGNYPFRKLDDLFDGIHVLFAEHNVFIEPRSIKREETQFQSKQGTTMFRVVQEMEYKFRAEDGSHTESYVVGEGIDSSDKASIKSMQNALKYCLIQMFTIPVTDQVDADTDTPEITQDTPTNMIIPKNTATHVLSDKGLEKIPPKNYAPQSQTQLTIEALVNYKDRNMAKTAGFKFDDHSKRWLKTIDISDNRQYPFETRDV